MRLAKHLIEFLREKHLGPQTDEERYLTGFFKLESENDREARAKAREFLKKYGHLPLGK